MKNKYEDIIESLSDREILFHVYATQFLLVIVSFILGFFLFDDFPSFWSLFSWSDRNVWIVGGGAGIAVVIVDVVLMKLLPPSYYDDGGLNVKVFAPRSYVHIAVISAIVAFSEEILFRGVIQTHFGLFISSTIFALIHYRYLFNKFLMTNVLTLSFLIGFIYMKTNNLAVTIFMHFLIDFLLGVFIKKSKSTN